MGKLAQLLDRELKRQLAAEGFQRERAEWVFTEWRDRYISALAASIRVQPEVQQAGIQVPRMEQSREWCSAAIHWLTVPDLGMQDYFLRADRELKNMLVRAVIEDGGMENMAGYFVELPPI